MRTDEPVEIQKTQEVLGRHPRERKSLIAILQDIQEEFGYLPGPAMAATARFLRMPESAIYGVATFYSTFSLVPQGKHRVSVCSGTACHVRGSAKIVDGLERELDIKIGGTTDDMMFSLETVRCLGCCGRAPVLTVNKNVYGNATATSAVKAIKKYSAGAD